MLPVPVRLMAFRVCQGHSEMVILNVGQRKRLQDWLFFGAWWRFVLFPELSLVNAPQTTYHKHTGLKPSFNQKESVGGSSPAVLFFPLSCQSWFLLPAAHAAAHLMFPSVSASVTSSADESQSAEMRQLPAASL